jgi:methionyl-tRNA formyltransferase
MQSLNIIFAGTPDFAVPSLQALIDSKHTISCVYTQPDRPAGRGQVLTASPIKQLALHAGIPVRQPTSLKLADEQQILQAWQADVMIVVAYGMLLPAAVLNIPRLGCVNVHASLLPRWRGAAPIQRAMIAGDIETGITIMQMDVGLDTGAMLKQASCPIYPDDTAQSLHDRLSLLGAQTLLATLPGIQTRTIQPQKQEDSLACYAHKLEKQEAVIDWNQPAILIEKQVRAFNPWPVASTSLNEQTIRLWSAQVLTAPAAAIPGTIIAATKAGIDVATGNGILRLTELQLAGGKRLPVAALLNAHRHLFQPGKRLT